MGCVRLVNIGRDTTVQCAAGYVGSSECNSLQRYRHKLSCCKIWWTLLQYLPTAAAMICMLVLGFLQKVPNAFYSMLGVRITHGSPSLWNYFVMIRIHSSCDEIHKHSAFQCISLWVPFAVQSFRCSGISVRQFVNHVHIWKLGLVFVKLCTLNARTPLRASTDQMTAAMQVYFL